MIKVVLRAATTLENRNGEQRALRKFSARRNLASSFNKRNVLHEIIWLGNLADTVQPIPAASFGRQLCLV